MARWREIMRFSKWLLINNFVGFVVQRSPTFVIGKLIGAHGVGLYSIANEIAATPTTELVAPIRRAIFPGYSKLASERGLLRDSFLKTWLLIFAVGAPVGLGILLVAGPLVRVFLGTRWLDAIPVIEIMAVWGFVGLLSSNSGPTYLALGKPKILTLLVVASAAVKIPALVIGALKGGVEGAAWAITAASIVWVFVDLFIISRLLEIQIVRDMLRPGSRTIFATVMMVVSVLSVQHWIPVSEASLPEAALELAVRVVTGIVTYIGGHCVLWLLLGRPPGPETAIFQATKNALQKSR